MNYELAKQLKEAGFSMPESHCHNDRDGEGECTHCDNLFDYCYPTLEELIEACGEDFTALMKDDGEWFCPAWRKHGFSTPTEAVAKLWLALNKSNATQ